MRDFNKLLQKGNFTPKERVLLLVANTVKQERTGKEILSEAGKRALGDGWQPLTAKEADEFNRFNRAWKMVCFGEMDAQTIYLGVKIKHQTMGTMLKDFVFYPIHSEVKQALDELGKIKRVDEKEAREIINAQRQEKLKKGFDFERATYELAFEIMDADTKGKLLDLYADAQTESEYLDDEQELADLYKNKDLEGIAERISKRCYNSYAKEYQLFHYYACIPISDIAKRYAKEKGLPYENTAEERKALKAKGELLASERLAETLAKHAEDNKTTVEDIIRQTCLKMLNEGLLEKDYTPLVIADPELLNKWLAEREKARQTLRDLIGKGTLATGTDGDGGEIITGESLYNSGLDYAFVKWFRDYADTYSPDLGLVIGEDGKHRDQELLISEKDGLLSRYKMHLRTATGLLEGLSVLQEKEENGEIVLDIEKGRVKEMFLRFRNDFIAECEKLFAFEAFFQRLSKTFEMDLTFRINIWVTECKKMIDSYNETLTKALDNINPLRGDNAKKKHFKTDEFFIDKDKIKPNNPLIELYYKEIATILGDDFK